MDRKKPVDELAIAKSAAWAWHQRGTGKEIRPVPEFIPRRNVGAPKPTRYKVEAMSKKQSPIPRSDLSTNSLLDKYEIERILRELDFYIKSGGSGCRRIVPESEKSGGKGKRESKKTKGFWPRGDGVVCGSINDVVVVESGGSAGRRRRTENHVPVVEFGSCRPRRSHAGNWL